MNISIRNKLLNILGVTAGKNTCIKSLRSLVSARSKGIRFGSECIINCQFAIDREKATISIGDRCYVGKSNIVSALSVVIEDDVIISWGVTIVDHNSHALSVEHRLNDVRDWHSGGKDWSHVESLPVLIQRGAWVGFNAIILKGVTIGEGSIVGAGSVVTKDVKPQTIVAGNPAKLIRTLDDE